MFEDWVLLLVSLGYTGFLFVVALAGHKFHARISSKNHALIYALSLGVYCTSWSFLGTTAQAADNILSHIPIYLGPILLFIFAWPVITRLIKTSLKLNLTSIADLLASRFGKSPQLAVLVTMVTLIGTLPYIALQIKAIVNSFQLLVVKEHFSNWQIGLAVSAILVGFTIVFGIRSINVTERHPGVMLAIAFESVVKLIALTLVGIFVCFWLYDSPLQLFEQAATSVDLSTATTLPSLTSMFGLLVIVMAAFLVLPRQFQVMIVELKDIRHISLARTMFPLYLLAFALLAIPLGVAGVHVLGDMAPRDAYVLLLPSANQLGWLTLLAFVGAISAASSMVIICTMALSTMLSNEVVFPRLFKQQSKVVGDFTHFKWQMLRVRKLLALFIIALSYVVFLLTTADTLSTLGEIAFGAVAQLMPALLAAFYWRNANLIGVYSGISIGFMMWFVLNLLPAFGLYPSIFENNLVPATTMATLLSLTVNVLVLWWFSQLTRPTVRERIQAQYFIPQNVSQPYHSHASRMLAMEELQALVASFLGEDKAEKSFAQFLRCNPKDSMAIAQFNERLLQHTEKVLSGVMGASSAQLVLSSAMDGRDIDLNDIAFLVEQALSEKREYSLDLLTSAIENASEGMSIIDENLNLVAWNQKYIELFDYPDTLLVRGQSIESLIRYNAQRGLFGSEDIEHKINKRIDYLQAGSSHQSVRELANGKTIRLQGNPLPGGGFVMIFTDITAYRHVEKILTEKNLDLEGIVKQHTRSLAESNRALAKANDLAAKTSREKSQYLKACSHDLMQPLEAAKLFASALSEANQLTDWQRQQVNNIENALAVANDLLASLGEIARIESGKIKAQNRRFNLQALANDLIDEYKLLAGKYHVEFRVVNMSFWLDSDIKLVRRVLQNFIGNAFRYAANGKVLLGCRKRGQQLEIQVIDDGPGVAKDKQQFIFEQFTQLHTDSCSGAAGLGLGLNIAKSLSTIIGGQIGVKSTQQKGSTFYLRMPLADELPQVQPLPIRKTSGTLNGLTILCIDNEEMVLSGLDSLLKVWGVKTILAGGYHQGMQMFDKHAHDIDMVIADYHLENEHTGLALLSSIEQSAGHKIPCILITANTDPELPAKAQQLGFGFLAKMVKPAALRAMINAQLSQGLQGIYG
ncbi:PAS-domain containing protein [Thalassotalea maritima]|uniref:hybrid sensor histidine kinase/response regulator n=1 Tax=Thalassotalea maritima TaxID=3242416 RepID=UPI003527FE87